MDISLRLLRVVWITAFSCCSAAQAQLATYTVGDEAAGTVAAEDTGASPSDETADCVQSVGRCQPCRCVPCERCRPCGCGNAAHGCQPKEPWSLPQPCLLQRTGFKLGGWLEQGITFNGRDSTDGFNGPVATNDWDAQYQMNQLWLFLDRPANTDGCGVAWGGHLDMIYGSDWRFGINKGLEDRINGFDFQKYGLVIPQAYLEFAVNNLSVKLGHFAAILDYEAVPAPRNPFYSHSYSYGYTVPQLVTGLLGEYKLSDQWSVLSGFHRGWSMFEDNNDELDFMGGVKWNSANQRTKVAYAISVGPQDGDVGFNTIPGDQNRFVYSLVLQQKIRERLQYVLVHNLGTEKNAPTAGNTAEWYGLNQYFLYTINPKWNANLRAEWLRDDDGVRVAGPGNIPGVHAWSGRGFAGNFYEITAGLSWRPMANIIVRPECRYDWYDGLPGPTGLPFGGGNADDQFTAGVDAIITF
ncbi:MAG: porin [Planctomycetes bacterium]|nr:porin [Planctomycetota bacterium]